MTLPSVLSPTELIAALRRVHRRIRDHVVSTCETHATHELSAVADAGSGDTIFAIDRVSETQLVESLTMEIAQREPILLIGEGLTTGQLVLPAGASTEQVRWQIIVDPIDGTRGLMYQKRSGWILSGAARYRGAIGTLDQIEVAIQTEIPLVNQFSSDQFWTVRGGEVEAERYDRIRQTSTRWRPQPSSATDLRHSFATVCRFFPGGRDLLATLDDQLMQQLLGPPQPDEALVFEDQYACTGGQLASLLTGRDRLVVDVRPWLARPLASRQQTFGLTCHPYDLCTSLIAEQVGVEITDPRGDAVVVPLDTTTPVAWIGYANLPLRRQIEPKLQSLLTTLGFGPHPD